MDLKVSTIHTQANHSYASLQPDSGALGLRTVQNCAGLIKLGMMDQGGVLGNRGD